MHPRVPKGGVKRLKYDKRDYDFKKTFGVTKSTLELLPETLNRVPLSIKDQQFTNFCTGYGVSAASEYQEGIELSPEYQTAKIGQIYGQPILNGAEPRSALKSAVTYGSLPQSLSPYRLNQDGQEKVANWDAWPEALDQLAAKHKKKRYYRVTYGYPDDLDVFDSIKIGLWFAKESKGVVVAFGNWYEEWNHAQPKGIVSVPQTQSYSRHCYLFIDWKQIDGKEYLVAQLSSGTLFGDRGLLYFSREAVNEAYRNPIINGLGLYILVDEVENTIVPVGTSFGSTIINLVGRLYDFFKGL